MKPACKSAGLTLVELAVILIVIVILTFLVLPAMHQNRMQAVRTQCAGNVRQQVLAWLMYLSDYGLHFPEAELLGCSNSMGAEHEEWGGPGIRYGGAAHIQLVTGDEGRDGSFDSLGTADADGPPPWCWVDGPEHYRVDDLDDDAGTGFKVHGRLLAGDDATLYVTGNEDPIINTYVNNELRVFACPSAKELANVQDGEHSPLGDILSSRADPLHHFNRGNDYCANLYGDPSPSVIAKLRDRGFSSQVGPPDAAAPWGRGHMPMNLSGARLGGMWYVSGAKMGEVWNASKVWIVGEGLMRLNPLRVAICGGPNNAFCGDLDDFRYEWWGANANVRNNVSWHDRRRPMVTLGFLDGHVEYVRMQHLVPVHEDMWHGGPREDENPTADGCTLYDTPPGAPYWCDPSREK